MSKKNATVTNETVLEPLVPNLVEPATPLEASSDTETESTSSEERVVSAREETMKEIIASRQKVFARELNEEIPSDEAQPVTEEVVEKPAAPEVPAAVEKVKLVVDGRELEVDHNELIKLAQVGTSSTQRFEEAKRMREEAQAIANSLKQMSMAPQVNAPQQNLPVGQQPTPVNSGQPSTDIIDKESAKKIVHKINYGSEEEQVEAIRELYSSAVTASSRGANALPPDQLVNLATQNALAAFHYNQNMNQLATEFVDVFSDRNLSIGAGALANMMLQENQQNGSQKAYPEILRDALSQMRTYIPKDDKTTTPEVRKDNPAPAKASPSVVVTADRVERKRAVPQPPSAATKIASDTDTRRQVSAADIVAQMRKSRHQSAY